MMDKNKPIILVICLLFCFFLVMTGCKKSDSDGNGTLLVSINGRTDSHRQGDNCMNCHSSGGSGKGVFTVAGTVYNQAQSAVSPNGTVRLYSETNGGGSFIATLQVDGLGNFYTTEFIDFGSSRFAQVSGASGNTKNMVGSFNSGACNSCHGSGGVDRIWVD